MKNETRLNDFVDNLINPKWMVIGVVIFFYGLMLKREIVSVAIQTGVLFNNWDISLRIVTDMYLIVYFIFPIVLFISSKTILEGFDYQILIRLGSFKKWIYRSLRKFWNHISILLFVWIFVSLFLAIGFPLSMNWSQLSVTDHFTNTLYGLVSIFQFPSVVLIAQFILLIISLSLLHTTLAIAHVLTQNHRIVIVISILLFLSGIVGFKLLPNEIAFLSPTTYFSLTKGVETFNSLLLLYATALVFGIIIMIFLQQLDRSKKAFVEFIKQYAAIVIFLFLCIIAVFSASGLNPSNTTVWDVWVMSYRGVNAESFSYLPFFNYVIVYFGFAYLIQSYLYKEIDQLGYYKIIRFRNLYKWFWSWMKKLLIVLFLFLVGLFGLSVIIAFLKGLNIDFGVTILSNPLNEVFYQFFINGFLQMLFYIIAIFIVTWIFKEPVYGLILISLFMILMFPVMSVLDLVPVGLNSLVYLVDYSPYLLTIILFASNMIGLGIIHFLFKRSLK